MMYDENFFAYKKWRYNVIDDINDFNENNIFTIIWICYAQWKLFYNQYNY